ncbi:MAG: alpha/beta fold hydrolase [Polyangiaceae bacterium]|nr:alpha/beta fold hydrolase [Polyangiaceae bacterium]
MKTRVSERRGLAWALGFVTLGVSLAGGCGGNSQVSTSGTSGTGSGFITGAGGGNTSSSTGSSQGGTTSTGTTSTGTVTEDPKLGAPYPVVLCHGFFGFDEFAGVEQLPYFYNVPERLSQDGENLVFTPAVDPFNSSDFRSDQLIEIIENEILTETGHDKVILIGHSQGGLDARAVAAKRPDLVAAVVTVATPHQGSRVADIALGLVDDPEAAAVIDAMVKLLGGPLYDQVGDETSLAKALYLFTQPGIQEFNAKYPNQSGVYYASITGRTDNSLGGQDCAADVDLPFVSELAGDKDPTDPLFVLSETILDGGAFGKIPNDGLVRAEDARWGEFWGCVPADHMDEVGQLIGDNPGLGNNFDHEEMFSEIVKRLRYKGF